MLEIVVLLSVFIFGYVLGNRHGRESGYIEAKSLAPLELRQKSQELGRCILCDPENDDSHISINA